MECARLPTGSDTTIGAATCLRFDLARREGVRDGPCDGRLHAARIRRAWEIPDVAFQLQPLSSDEEDTDADGEEGADDHQDDDEYWIPSR